MGRSPLKDRLPNNPYSTLTDQNLHSHGGGGTRTITLHSYSQLLGRRPTGCVWAPEDAMAAEIGLVGTTPGNVQRPRLGVFKKTTSRANGRPTYEISRDPNHAETSAPTSATLAHRKIYAARACTASVRACVCVTHARPRGAQRLHAAIGTSHAASTSRACVLHALRSRLQAGDESRSE